MNLKGIKNLENEELIAYYDMSIKVAKEEQDYVNKINECIKKEKKKLFAQSLYKNFKIILPFVLGILVWLILGRILYVICDNVYELWDYEDYVWIVAMPLGILSGILLFVNKKFLKFLSDTQKDIKDYLEEINDEEEKLHVSMNNLRATEEYNNMLIVFEDKDISKMKRLRDIIRSGVVGNHEAAMQLDNENRKHSENIKAEEEKVRAIRDNSRAIRDNSRANDNLADSQRDLIRSMNQLSDKIDDLKQACSNGTISGEDKVDVLDIITKCSTLLLNLKNFIK